MIDYITLTIKVALSLILILGLIYLFFVYGGGKLQTFQNKKYLKVLERVPVTKDNALLVVKMGQKGFVVASSQGKMEIISEVEHSDLEKLENDKVVPKQINILEMLKNFRKKEEKDEKQKL